MYAYMSSNLFVCVSYMEAQFYGFMFIMLLLTKVSGKLTEVIDSIPVEFVEPFQNT